MNIKSALPAVGLIDLDDNAAENFSGGIKVTAKFFRTKSKNTGDGGAGYNVFGPNEFVERGFDVDATENDLDYLLQMAGNR